MAILKAVRGTRDLLPPETALWNHVESTARTVFARYGFGEIRTPIFESTELFARGVGEETDIVSKEMFESLPAELGTSYGGEALDAIVKKAWFEQHGNQYNLVSQGWNEPFAVARRDNRTPSMMVFKYHIDEGTLTKMLALAEEQAAWLEKLELTVAVPEWEESEVRRMSHEVEVHPVRM